jgi:hypothetical protein
MCNACGNVCCGSDQFEGCGCDGCHEPDCWQTCECCDLPHDECRYHGQFGVDDDHIIGPDLDHIGTRERPEFLG